MKTNKNLDILAYLLLLLALIIVLGGVISSIILTTMQTEKEDFVYPEVEQIQPEIAPITYQKGEPYITDIYSLTVVDYEKCPVVSPYPGIDNMVVKLQVSVTNLSNDNLIFCYHTFTKNYSHSLLYCEGEKFSVPVINKSTLLRVRNIEPEETYIGWIYIVIPKNSLVFEFEYEDVLFIFDFTLSA